MRDKNRIPEFMKEFRKNMQRKVHIIRIINENPFTRIVDIGIRSYNAWE